VFYLLLGVANQAASSLVNPPLASQTICQCVSNASSGQREPETADLGVFVASERLETQDWP